MASRLVKKGGEIKDAFMRDLVNALAKLGGESALYAYRKKNYTNRTFNLHDSYGSAVYVNGVLQPNTIRYAGGQMSHRPGILQRTYKPIKRRSKLGQRSYRYGKNGRDVLNTFFMGNKYYEGHKFGKSGIVLVVVAAMWYASILEGKGYKVVTDASNEYLNANIDRVVREVCQQHGVPKKYVRFSAFARADEDYFGEEFKYKYER